VGGRHSVLVRLAALTGVALLVLAASGGVANAAEDGFPAPAPAASGPIRSIRKYAVPAVRLVRDDGKVVSLPDEMNDGRPIVLNFIFTTCSSICPLMSSVFAQFERRLAADADKVHLMSISTDPEQDTPDACANTPGNSTPVSSGSTTPGRWPRASLPSGLSTCTAGQDEPYRSDADARGARQTLAADRGIRQPDDLVRDYRELLAAR